MSNKSPITYYFFNLKLLININQEFINIKGHIVLDT